MEINKIYAEGFVDYGKLEVDPVIPKCCGSDVVKKDVSNDRYLKSEFRVFAYKCDTCKLIHALFDQTVDLETYTKLL